MLRDIINRLKNKNKIVIYTAITGNYDNLIDPKYIDENCDYICFTDNVNLQSDVWKIIYVDIDNNLENVKSARKYKILPNKYLPDYKESIWVDANYQIIGSLREYVNKYSKGSSIICMIHPQRNCIYEEGKACIIAKKDKEDIIIKQMKQYELEGYPEHNGLIASGVIYRKHNDEKLIRIMKEWWCEIKKYSRRDQLSFNYVCWKNNFNYDKSDINCFGNEYLKRVEHN